MYPIRLLQVVASGNVLQVLIKISKAAVRMWTDEHLKNLFFNLKLIKEREI